MAHTPGPWTPTVAYGHGGYPEFWVDNEVPATRDDMRLIAAAPELLEALRKIAATYETAAYGCPESHAMSQIALAAIAKAEGR